MLDRGAVRLARAATFASVAVALSVTAHLAGGGNAPGPGALALGGLGVLAVAVLVTGRRVGRLAMLTLLAGSQVVLHSMFAALGAAPSGAGCLSGGHHAHASACAPDAMAGHAATGGTTMLLAHVGATVALGLVLARGEQVLWSLAAGLGLTLPAPVVVPAPTGRPSLVITTPVLPRPALLLVPLLRGPPQVSLAR